MMRVVENGNLKMNVDGFIIPNKAGLLDGFIVKGRLEKYLDEVTKLNGIPYDKEKDKLVQLWFVEGHWTREALKEADEEDYCDSLAGHPFKVIRATDEKRFYASIPSEYLPESYLRGHKEGDEINVKVPMRTMKFDDPEETWEFTLDMNIRLNQGTYRYRSFGSFEDVLKKVTN